MKKLNLLSRAEMRNVMGGLENTDGGGIEDGMVKKNKCCPEGYSQGSSGVQIVCSDCTTGNYCAQGTLVAC
ncbi:hypothetical protein OC25_00425 [Pedobacter kyungheensis]|uniref:Bacteriocin n=1 Tax=Pedobacter kyungheensis TaxID=1069985 RepID=A0A0C1FVA0_9SPHI|nr:hypothetical protein [Pedobacter kyungheensis]KIA96912.1 hypothetical protein OC25_00425 [Pedobacter kyungheensis]